MPSWVADHPILGSSEYWVLLRFRYRSRNSSFVFPRGITAGPRHIKSSGFFCHFSHLHCIQWDKQSFNMDQVVLHLKKRHFGQATSEYLSKKWVPVGTKTVPYCCWWLVPPAYGPVHCPAPLIFRPEYCSALLVYCPMTLDNCHKLNPEPNPWDSGQ